MLSLPRPILSLPRLRVPGPLLALLGRRKGTPAQARPQRMGADELRAMGERELKDLGIGRCEIEYFARQASRGGRDGRRQDA